MKCNRIGRFLLAVAVILTCAVSLQAQQPVFVRVWDCNMPLNTSHDRYGVFSLAVGDLNRDGKPDIYAASMDPDLYTSPEYWIAQGATPRGTFTEEMQDGGGWPAKVYIGDWNNDGHNDVLWFQSRYVPGDYYGQYCTYRNTGSTWTSASWEADSAATNIGGPFNMCQPVDCNMDGKPDIVTIRNVDGSLALHLNDGTGHFPNTDTYVKVLGGFGYMDATDDQKTQEIYPLAAGHLDATSPAGQNDIVLARPGDGALYVLFQHPQGVFNQTGYTWKAPDNYGGYVNYIHTNDHNDLHLRVTHLGIGDFNGDGKNDIVVARENGDLFINYQNPGTPVPDFNTRALIQSTGHKFVDMKIGDVDGDGRADIVTARSDGVLAVLYQKAPGVFNYQVIDQWIKDANDPNSGMITSIAIGDMDNDGIRDITVGLNDGRIFTYYGLCSKGLEGDLTGDCMVDFRDVSHFALQWLGPPYNEVTPYNGEDLNGDGTVNFKDMAILARDWMTCNLIPQSNCWK